MADFMIRFLLCNVLLCGSIGILLLFKWLFRNILSSRMQYHLWFCLLGLFALPFLPARPIFFPELLSWLARAKNSSAVFSNAPANTILTANASATTWMNDFTISVNKHTPSTIGYLLFAIWVLGMLAMLILIVKSTLRLRRIEKSALPLQNPAVRSLYRQCKRELGLRRKIPIYSTAFLKTPIIVGLFKPRIYLPISLLSDCPKAELRYMLLHELQHYKHGDALANMLMNLAGVVYWFHPLVWYSLKEMRDDRELACDSSVLKMLEANDYEAYGTTLINFAEKLSLSAFPFASLLSGNMRQMKKRILNIASYEKPNHKKRLKGLLAFVLTFALILGFTPFISTRAADNPSDDWDASSKNISYLDLSKSFGKYEGSFVLYDLKNDSWKIYNKKLAATRLAPNSTYKIYLALFGLEENVISAEHNVLAWDGTKQPFDAWNADQTLKSAMSNSVNWYFQALDQQLGTACLNKYIRKIKYGNQNLSSDLSSYWMEASLKISPIEQVELLTKLQKNDLPFAQENIAAVKDSIYLFSSAAGSLYGKTGTGCVDGQNVNGSFIGYVETEDNAYIFSSSIKAKAAATGSQASKIALSILSNMDIWK